MARRTTVQGWGSMSVCKKEESTDHPVRKASARKELLRESNGGRAIEGCLEKLVCVDILYTSPKCRECATTLLNIGVVEETSAQVAKLST